MINYPYMEEAVTCTEFNSVVSVIYTAAFHLFRSVSF